MKYKDMTQEQKEAYNARHKKWNHEHREDITERRRQRRAKNRKNHRECQRKYKSRDVNSTGETKHRIRFKSRYILSKNHTKLSSYELHHCFGYDDPNRFIYIPRTLHQKIHQHLRDNNISADSEHWNAIRDIVNSCEEYTYIRT